MDTTAHENIDMTTIFHKEGQWSRRFVASVAVALVLFSTSSCTDFLTMTPRNEKVVRTAEDYRDIMGSFVKMMKTPNQEQFGPLFGVDYYAMPKWNISTFLAIFSNEVTLNDGTTLYYDAKSNSYNTAGLNILSWKYSDGNIWNQYFSMLGCLNLIISDIDNMIIEDVNVRNMVVGEALVWRAYGYYKLLQYYAPYEDEALGLPIVLDPTNNIGDIQPKRAGQKEVFDLILSDLKGALALLDKTPSQPWNFAYQKPFIEAFLSDVYWYKADGGAKAEDDWANALKHAEQAMQGRTPEKSADKYSLLFDISRDRLNAVPVSDEYYIRLMEGPQNQKFNFRRSYASNGTSFTNGKVTEEYLSLYTDNDIRKAAFITADGRVAKYNILGHTSEQGYGVFMPFRLADVCLIAAEAAVHLGDMPKARHLMSEFAGARYTTPISMPDTGKELLDAVRQERKKEFFAEIDARWIMMKRYGEEYSRSVGNRSFKLERNDFRYTFPIPYEEINRNKNMIQNPGWI